VVMPDKGQYFAITSAGGGYAIPITTPDTYELTFFGGSVALVSQQVVVGQDSMLLDYLVTSDQATLTLKVNQSTFRTGEQLTLTAVATPGSIPVTADVYIALQLPGCTSLTCILFWQGGLNFTTLPQPIVRNWLISSFNGMIFSYTFGGTEPVGSYVWLRAFAVPGTGTLIGGIAQAPFTFSP
jgi:hypothetical protein